MNHCHPNHALPEASGLPHLTVRHGLSYIRINPRKNIQALRFVDLALQHVTEAQVEMVSMTTCGPNLSLTAVLTPESEKQLQQIPADLACLTIEKPVTQITLTVTTDRPAQYVSRVLKQIPVLMMLFDRDQRTLSLTIRAEDETYACGVLGEKEKTKPTV